MFLLIIYNCNLYNCRYVTLRNFYDTNTWSYKPDNIALKVQLTEANPANPADTGKPGLTNVMKL